MSRHRRALPRSPDVLGAQPPALRVSVRSLGSPSTVVGVRNSTTIADALYDHRGSHRGRGVTLRNDLGRYRVDGADVTCSISMRVRAEKIKLSLTCCRTRLRRVVIRRNEGSGIWESSGDRATVERQEPVSGMQEYDQGVAGDSLEGDAAQPRRRIGHPLNRLIISQQEHDRISLLASGGDKDAQVVLTLAKSAAGGNAQACFHLANSLRTGGLGLVCDPERAAGLYAFAAERGHAEAQAKLAAMLQEGVGGANGPGLAQESSDKAAGQGSESGKLDLPEPSESDQYNAGLKAFEQVLNSVRCSETGVALLKRADGGNLKARFLLVAVLGSAGAAAIEDFQKTGLLKPTSATKINNILKYASEVKLNARTEKALRELQTKYPEAETQLRWIMQLYALISDHYKQRPYHRCPSLNLTEDLEYQIKNLQYVHPELAKSIMSLLFTQQDHLIFLQESHARLTEIFKSSCDPGEKLVSVTAEYMLVFFDQISRLFDELSVECELKFAIVDEKMPDDRFEHLWISLKPYYQFRKKEVIYEDILHKLGTLAKLFGGFVTP